MAKQTPAVKKNDRVRLDITATGSEGQGIGRKDGYTVFVPGALPGETVLAHILKAGKSYGVGKLVELLKPSDVRVMPKCNLHGVCGGCSLMHMEYGAQLNYKRSVVSDAFSRIGGFCDVEVSPVIGMDEPYNYRNKASFPFASIDGRVELGFFAPRSHRVVPADDCALQKEDVMIASLAVRDWARMNNISVYDEQSRSGLLRHVVVRANSFGEVMVMVVVTAAIPHERALIELLQERIPGLESVYLNINRKDTNVILGEDYRLIFGNPAIRESLLGLDFTLGPASFLQVNHVQAEGVYDYALKLIAFNEDELAVDAYCGIGVITLLLAKRVREAIGIESVAQAVDDARRNAKSNGMDNARFILGEAETVLPKLIENGLKIGALILDPPRKGAEEAFLNAAAKCGVERIVYISCDPATLSRDCAILAGSGYDVKSVQPFDMFPMTPHVETVALLSKSKE